MIGILLLAFLILIIGFILFRPLRLDSLTSQPHPAKDFPDALQRIEVLRRKESSSQIPESRLQFMSHGGRTERAIVLIHGYTNCACQFVELGNRLHAQGSNVLIVTMPHHGLANRLNTSQERLTSEELVAYTDEVVDIAHGLGEQVIVAGLSCGGLMAAWAGQNRKDVSLAMPIAPAFGLRKIPSFLTMAATNLFLILPNVYFCFFPERKSAGTPDHTYPRYSSRALAQIIRLGFAVRSRCRKEPPAARSLVVVTNANDQLVRNELTAQVVKAWRQHGANIKTYEFDAGLGLDHDMIDPAQPAQRIDLVYPHLIEFILQRIE
jgi:carboxylesterase